MLFSERFILTDNKLENFHLPRPVTMLVYVTLKPENVVFGLVQETVREYSVTLLKTISVAGSGPGERKQGDYYSQAVVTADTTDHGHHGGSGGILHDE